MGHAGLRDRQYGTDPHLPTHCIRPCDATLRAAIAVQHRQSCRFVPRTRESSGQGVAAGDSLSHWMPGQARHGTEEAGDTVREAQPIETDMSMSMGALGMQVASSMATAHHRAGPEVRCPVGAHRLRGNGRTARRGSRHQPHPVAAQWPTPAGLAQRCPALTLLRTRHTL